MGQWKSKNAVESRLVCLWKHFSDMRRGKSITICSQEYNLVWVKKTSLYIQRRFQFKRKFTLYTCIFYIKLSRATCLQLDLCCVNEAHNAPITTEQRNLVVYVCLIYSTIQVVSRLHATVLRSRHSGRDSISLRHFLAFES